MKTLANIIIKINTFIQNFRLIKQAHNDACNALATMQIEAIGDTFSHAAKYSWETDSGAYVDVLVKLSANNKNWEFVIGGNFSEGWFFDEVKTTNKQTAIYYLQEYLTY